MNLGSKGGGDVERKKSICFQLSLMLPKLSPVVFRQTITQWEDLGRVTCCMLWISPWYPVCVLKELLVSSSSFMSCGIFRLCLCVGVVFFLVLSLSVSEKNLQLDMAVDCYTNSREFRGGWFFFMWSSDRGDKKLVVLNCFDFVWDVCSGRVHPAGWLPAPAAVTML